MQTLIDLETAPVFAVPLRDGGIHEGILLEGPQGWGEFSPPPQCPDERLGRWLTAATEAGTVGWPDPKRGQIPAAVRIGAVDPQAARAMTATSGCRTAVVEVAAPGHTIDDDVARVQAVREALGPDGAVRCDAKGRWETAEAVTAIAALDGAAGGMEFVAHPCPDAHRSAAVRRLVTVPVALPADLILEDRSEVCADIAVLHCGVLGGARRALRVAESLDLPCVVTSGTQTSIGAAVGVALAGALPDLHHGCDVSAGTILATDVVAASRSLIPVGGMLPVAPMSPAPSRDVLDRFTQADPDRIRWWRRRLQTAIAQ
ncbi:enolase C-terminal domain-like protein [Mycobacterium sp. NPDC003323]